MEDKINRCPFALLFRPQDDWRFAHQTGNFIARSEITPLLEREGDLSWDGE